MVFFVTLFLILVLLSFRRKRNKEVVVRRSFGRSQAPEGVGIDNVRKHDVFEKPDKKEGRGRLYLLAALIAGVFGTLVMRLWSLQLISSDFYQSLAEENITSDASIPATRGRILDRNGIELVGNRPSLCVVAAKKVASDPIVVHLLSLILGIPKGVVRKNILDDSAGVQADRMVATDVPMHAVAFIRERQRLFSGVSVVERTVRTYPYGYIAAHVLGYIGPVTEADLILPNEAIDYQSGDLKGISGAEQAFENILQGIHGTRTYKVDVGGAPIAVLSESPPINGSDVCLTIDVKLQRATDRIIQEVIESSHLRGFQYANAGALVCIDVKDGGILASTSYPTYYPAEFTNGISTELYAQLNDKASAYPLMNRVIAGRYPAASTFKAFTSLAGLEFGIIGEETRHSCNGIWEYYGEEWGQRCWIYPNGHGTLGLEEAINQSCDVYFYNVGADFWSRWRDSEDKVDTFQDYLRTWGFGAVTGVDIPGENEGQIPTAQWKAETFSDTPEEAQWQGGDMTNMAIGQGDILITPIQLANGYAGIARKKMVKPHYFHSVLNDKGDTVITAEPEEFEVQPVINNEHIERVYDGLKRVVERMGGGFNQLPVTVAGKSGTAEVKAAEADFSWYVAFAPAEDPKYCVACVVEQAGDGSSAAVLGVQHTLATIYDVDLGSIIVEQGSRER